MYQAQIANRPAFAHIQVQLAPGQKILAAARTMNWMDGEDGMHDDDATLSCDVRSCTLMKT